MKSEQSRPFIDDKSGQMVKMDENAMDNAAEDP